MDTMTSPDFNPAFSAGPPGAGVTTCIQSSMLFVAYMHDPHATAFAPTPVADAVTAKSSVVVLHSMCARQSSMAIPNAHGPGMAQKITKQCAVLIHKP